MKGTLVFGDGKPVVLTSRHNRTENPRVRKLLLFIHEFKDLRDYSPNVREMGNAVGISSTSVVMYYLRRLREDDMVDFNFREARTIRLTRKGKEMVSGWLKVENPKAFLRREVDKLAITS